MQNHPEQTTDRADLFHWVNVSLAQVQRIMWRQPDVEGWGVFPNDDGASNEGYVLVPGYRFIIELTSDGHLSIIRERIKK